MRPKSPEASSRTASNVLLVWIIILGISASLAACGNSDAGRKVSAKSQRPNILVILIDTLRNDRMGYAGYSLKITPNIDRLASTSTVFMNCHSQAPWTTPSVASMFTSLYPSELGITDVPNKIADSFDMLPEVLQRNGYETGAVVSHSFLNSEWNFNQGFDDFNEKCILGHQGTTSPAVTDLACQFIRKPRSKPFFLFAHYFDPHSDYYTHEGFDLTQGLQKPDALFSGIPLSKVKEMVKSGSLDEDGRKYLEALYDSEVAFTDSYVGKLLDAMESDKILDDSLVILMSDHGEEFVEHGWLGHSHTLYEELLHVPFLIKFPHSREGVVESQSVALIDVSPTLFEILGIPLSDGMRGRSLLPLLKGKVFESIPIFAETSRNGDLRAILQDGWKVIFEPKADRHKVYDLNTDAGETQDLESENLKKPERLKVLLSEWLALMDKKIFKPQNVPLSEEKQKELESLSYGKG